MSKAVNVSLSYVIRKVVESWIPVIVAGIIIYIIYYLTVHVFNILPRYLGTYEDVLRLTLAIIIGSLLVLRTGREVSRILQPYDPHTSTAVKFILQFIIVISVIAFIIASAVSISPAAAAFSGTVIGLVLGLAFQSTLSDLFSGLVILLSKPLKPGEHITFVSWRYSLIRTTYPTEAMPNGFTGTVVDVGLMYTTILLDTGEVVKVPNSALKDALIISHSSHNGRLIRVRLDLPASVNVHDFERELQEELRSDHLSDVKVYVEETWQQINMYQVAIVVKASGNGLSKDEVKDLVLRKALAVRDRLSRSAKS